MGGGRAWARDLGVIVGSREKSAVPARPAGMHGFAALHARAKAGMLSPAERDEHRLLRGPSRTWSWTTSSRTSGPVAAPG
jgi:hypothetical protein